MRRLFLLLIVLVVVAIAAIKLGLLGFVQSKPAEVPSVAVTGNGIVASGGQAPAFEVQTGTVAVGTKNATIDVPVPSVEVVRPGNGMVPATAVPPAETSPPSPPAR